MLGDSGQEGGRLTPTVLPLVMTSRAAWDNALRGCLPGAAEMALPLCRCRALCSSSSSLALLLAGLVWLSGCVLHRFPGLPEPSTVRCDPSTCDRQHQRMPFTIMP
jgi:hypothetical protein